MRNGPIGQYLVQKGLITEEQLQEVLAKQKEQLAAQQSKKTFW